MCKCAFPEGVSVKPDGIHELSPHLFETMEIHRNVTVEVLQCKFCNEVEIIWHKQEDTDSEIIREIKE